MADDLTDARHKIERSKEHLDQVAALAKEYVTANPFKCRIERGQTPQNLVCIGRVASTPSAKFGVVIGDLAHNIRSALDIMVAAISNIPSSDHAKRRRLQFPICDDEESYQRAVEKQNRLSGVSPAQQAIIRTHQPFSTGKSPTLHPLAQLREMNDADKHRLLHVVAVAGHCKLAIDTEEGGQIRLQGGMFVEMPGLRYEVINNGVVSEADAPFAHFELTMKNAKSHLTIVPLLTLEVQNTRQLEGCEVLSTLARIIAAVESVANELSA